MTAEARASSGHALRKQVPRSAHATWCPTAARDPVALLIGQEPNRLPWLVAERHRRMSASPFSYFRGAAIVMATDLASTPSTGIAVQACGDAHLANFGLFASPERRLVFDVNDFDETLRGPWEWDVKRLAASCRIAAESRGLDAAQCDALTRAAVRAYRLTMHDFAGRHYLDAWYGEPGLEQQQRIERALAHASTRRTVEGVAARARRHDHLRAFDKLAETCEGTMRIRNDAPRLVPLRDLSTEQRPADLEASVLDAFEAYKSSLLPERRALLDRFRPLDFALKVVGVGSVGTRCFVMLLAGRDDADPLFLQFKEANASVLERVLGTPAPITWASRGRRPAAHADDERHLPRLVARRMGP